MEKVKDKVTKQQTNMMQRLSNQEVKEMNKALLRWFKERLGSNTERDSYIYNLLLEIKYLVESMEGDDKNA